MTKKPDALPQSGGSYLRQKNGDLKKVETPAEPRPLDKTSETVHPVKPEPKEA